MRWHLFCDLCSMTSVAWEIGFSLRKKTPQLQMYISLVRPNLEYASQVWNPYKVGEVNSLEHVQKFALRMCTKSWDTSYQELLQLFSLPDLHAATQAFCAHCFMEWLFYFSNDVFVHQTSSIITRSSTSQTLVLLHIHVVILTHLCHTLSALGISCLYTSVTIVLHLLKLNLQAHVY